MNIYKKALLIDFVNINNLKINFQIIKIDISYFVKSF